MNTKKIKIGILTIIILTGTLYWLPGVRGESVDIKVEVIPDHLIRYRSGNTVYVEGLAGDRWVGRYWTADGRINVPYELYADDAFAIQVDNMWLSKGWKWVGSSEIPEAGKGARHLVVELSNTLRPIDLKIHTRLDGTPVLVRWLELTNKFAKPVALSAVYPWSSRLWRSQDYRASLPQDSNSVFTLGYFTEVGHGWEGWFQWFPLKDPMTRIRYDVGHGANDPFFLVRNEAEGEYFIGALAWTANWEMEFKSEGESVGFGGGRFKPSIDANLWFKLGSWASLPQRVIEPQEKVITPALHLGHVEGDLDLPVQAMHEHVRRSVVPFRKPDRSYLIQYAVPGDQGYIARTFGDLAGMNEKNLLQQIDMAEALGAELFIVDAGWWDIYGEWTPSTDRFPRGLDPVVQYARSKGLLFGLYAEVEGARGDWSQCKWCKEHPDWFFPNYKNILNLTKPEVVAHVESQLSRMIDQYKLDLYRHDFNTPFTYELGQTPRSGIEENDYWRYYEGWYGILERIHKKYPDLILQQAAAGGMRNDLGMVSRWHEPYLTDGLNMPHVLENYAGQTLALPPEIFVIAFGIPANSPNRGHFDTHLRVTYSLGTPWLAPVAPSLQDMSPERLNRYRYYADLYKKFIRPLFPSCKMYHHAPVTATGGVTSSPWFVMEFAAPDRSKGWATLVRLRPGDPAEFVFKPRGLDPSKTYRVTLDSYGKASNVEGLRLIEQGIPVRLESTLSSELILFESQ
ncbi:MAG: alpha-galactosidase [Terriglobia bacterium]